MKTIQLSTKQNNTYYLTSITEENKQYLINLKKTYKKE